MRSEHEQQFDIERDPFEVLAEHNMLDLFDELSFRQKWARVFKGLKQPPESGENKWARLQLLRLLSPLAALLIPIMMLFLIALLAQLTPQSTQSFEVTVVEPTPMEELEEIVQPEIEPLEPPDPVDIEVDVQTDIAPTPTDVAAPAAEDVSVQPAEFDSVAQVRSPVVLTGIMGSRSPGARGAAISRYGGRWGDASHAALLRALQWLKENQLEDGSWAGNGVTASKPAMTGLALLTYLAHGETPSSERFGPTVQRAIEFLISIQNPDGRFRVTGEQAHKGGVYSQAIASYALAEAYSLTRIPMIREPMAKAITVIIEGQQDRGSWDYAYAGENNNRRGRNTSVAGFQAQALKAASITGVDIPGLEEAMKKAADGFKLQHAAGSEFLYSSNDNTRRPSMTAVATLCLQLLGESNSREARSGVESMREWVPSWDDSSHFRHFIDPMYAWYYATQVYFHEGGATWERWNDLFAPMLITNQNEDGSWGFEHTRIAAYGPVYSTTLAALMLTVYYRYLPTFQQISEEEIEQELGDDYDLIIDIVQTRPETHELDHATIHVC